MTNRMQVGFSLLISAWYGMACPRSGWSTIGGYGRAGPDIDKNGNGFDSGIEHEPAGAGANVIAFARRSGQGVRQQRAPHAKQLLAERVRDCAPGLLQYH